MGRGLVSFITMKMYTRWLILPFRPVKSASYAKCLLRHKYKRAKQIILISAFAVALAGIGCTGNNHTADNSVTSFSFDIRSIDSQGGYVYEKKIIEPARTAIVVTDMWHQEGISPIQPDIDHSQHDIAHIQRDGSFAGATEGFFYQERVCDSLNETLAAARALGFKIVHAPAGQVHIYEGHPARENIRRLAHAAYPWQEKPGWNYEQAITPLDSLLQEQYEAYTKTTGRKDGAGIRSYGQNPRIVITSGDFITADVEELWDLIKTKNIQTLIYMGGSTNLSVAELPYGLLNMKKYGIDVLMDRNHVHLVHRIPQRRNDDTVGGPYVQFYTNDPDSQQTIEHIEAHICPTLDGMEIREAAWARGGYTVPLQPVTEATPDAMFLKVSFQPQFIEIADNYIVDTGWEYGHNPNGLDYGWNRLKVKDAIREGYDPVQSSFIEVRPGDSWKLTGMPDYQAKLELSGAGELLINGVLHKINAEQKETLSFSGSGAVQLQLKSGKLRVYQLEGVKQI